MNGVGLEFNHLFGFGARRGSHHGGLAKQWKTVPARYHCEAGSARGFRRIPLTNPFHDRGDRQCAGSETEVNYLEHVQAAITLNIDKGGVRPALPLPMGTDL